MTSISIVDYIGKLEGGIGVILSVNINEHVFQMIYWFNKEGERRLVADENFLKLNDIKSMEEYSDLKNLIMYIDYKILPPREEIYKEFNI